MTVPMHSQVLLENMKVIRLMVIMVYYHSLTEDLTTMAAIGT